MSQSLPDSILPLHQRLTLSDEQVEAAGRLLDGMSRRLGSPPVILSQDGDLILSAGVPDRYMVERLARIAGRTWEGGRERITPEFIRFKEETFGDEGVNRLNIIIYSMHVSGALTLSIGWELSLTLMELREEVGRAKNELLQILANN